MTQKRTLQQVRQEAFLRQPHDIPNLESSTMSVYEQDELLSEILGSQLRRRAMSRYAVKPSWAQFF